MNYDLVAVDLDGTLVDENNTCSSIDADALHRLNESGVAVVIASGRMYRSTVTFHKRLNLNTPILCYNGAMIRHPANEFEWFHLPFPADLAAEVIRFCEDNELHLNFYLNDHLYAHRHTEWSDLYCSRTGSLLESVGDLRQFIGKSPTKLIIVDSPEKTNALGEHFRSLFGARANVTKSNAEYLEFMHAAANKAHTLARLAWRYGVPRNRVLAIGDGQNDLPMLQWAGFSVAMGNASDTVKKACRLVAPPLHENGLAWVVKELFGL